METADSHGCAKSRSVTERGGAVPPLPSRTSCIALLAACTFVAGAVAQAQAIRVYKARLSPVPIPAASQTVVGVGSVTATLTGTTLDVAGTFEGLASPATEARLHRSPKPGIRGPAVSS